MPQVAIEAGKCVGMHSGWVQIMQRKSRREGKFEMLFQIELYSWRLDRAVHMCSSLCSFDKLFGKFQKCGESANQTTRDQNIQTKYWVVYQYIGSDFTECLVSVWDFVFVISFRDCIKQIASNHGHRGHECLNQSFGFWVNRSQDSIVKPA